MTSKKKLPSGIKVIGIIGCLAGGWNTLMGTFGSIMVLSASAPEDPDMMTLSQFPVMKIVFPVALIIALVILISSIGLLKKKAWGRNGVLTSTSLVVLGFIAYIISLIIQMQQTSGEGSVPIVMLLVPVIIGCVMVGVPSGLIIWYLNRSQIREIYN